MWNRAQLAGLCDLVGPGGHVIGIDASQSMIAAARRRIRQAGWTNVTVICADAAPCSDAVIETHLGVPCPTRPGPLSLSSNDIIKGSSEDGVDALVGDLFFVVEGTNISG